MRYLKREGASPDGAMLLEYEKQDIGPVIADILFKRGITPSMTREYFYGDLGDLHDPMLFRDMEKILDRIKRAGTRNEKVTVYADYDCDGVSSCVIMLKTLRSRGIDCDYYIPDRKTEGYGTNRNAFEKIIGGGTSLIITVDCGIRSNDDIAYALKKGVDVIVMDHHEVGELPDTPYIMNGEVPSETYPFRKLCGAGITYRFACAFAPELKDELIEYAGLATIADMVPLVDENRIIARAGLRKLNSDPSMAFRYLINASGLKPGKLNVHSIGFGLAPRINAAGRLEHAELALRLFMTEDDREAMEIASRLNSLNEKRQQMQRTVIEEAEKMLREEKVSDDTRIIMLSSEHWDKGVLGLAAASLTQTFRKPSVVLNEEDGILSGSARSIPGVDLYGILESCEDLYEHFGGHEMAAGLSFRKENLQEIRDRLNKKASELNEDLFLPSVYYDEEITEKDLTERFAEQLRLLEPFGQDNPEPVFYVRDYPANNISVLANRHYKMKYGQADILYFFPRKRMITGRHYQIAATFSENEFRGNIDKQLIIRNADPVEPSLQTLMLLNHRAYMKEYLDCLVGMVARRENAIRSMEELLFFVAERTGDPNDPLLIVAASSFGLAFAEEVKKRFPDIQVTGQLDPSDRDSTICYSYPSEIPDCYRTIVLLGCQTRRADEGRSREYRGPELLEHYKETIDSYYVDPEDIEFYIDNFMEAAETGFESIFQIITETRKLIVDTTEKKVWFALKACMLDDLLQFYGNKGKILLKYSEKPFNDATNVLYMIYNKLFK
ncbi:MAG: single-stranded-DNA-specific exonuclease RecJ [Clostridia bacterium]|nr:single-stranded-DNA-specific exonuclease RecJ [Clostridia bacterium]